jgi:hypothetical protein
MAADLRQQALRTVLRRFAEKYRAKAKSTANGFFDDPQAVDGAIAFFRAFAMSESLAQFFYQRVVTAFDTPQSVLGVLLWLGSFLHARFMRGLALPHFRALQYLHDTRWRVYRGFAVLLYYSH